MSSDVEMPHHDSDVSVGTREQGFVRPRMAVHEDRAVSRRCAAEMVSGQENSEHAAATSEGVGTEYRGLYSVARHLLQGVWMCVCMIT